MLKQYLFKVEKVQYVTVSATNKEEAYERAEEQSLIETDNEEIVDIYLEDVYEEDIDAIIDEHRLYDEEDYYDEEDVDGNLYEC